YSKVARLQMFDNVFRPNVIEPTRASSVALIAGWSSRGRRLHGLPQCPEKHLSKTPRCKRGQAAEDSERDDTDGDVEQSRFAAAGCEGPQSAANRAAGDANAAGDDDRPAETLPLT